MQVDPDEVAYWCDFPVSECDLHARHRWLHGRAEFRERMKNDHEFYDAKVAGFWIWGLSCWIGSNFSRPKNQESLPRVAGDVGVNTSKQTPHLTGAQGVVSEKIPNLTPRGDATDEAVCEQLPGVTRKPCGGVHGISEKVPGVDQKSNRGDASEHVHEKRPNIDRPHVRGVHSMAADEDAGAKQIPYLHDRRKNLSTAGENIAAWFAALSTRLRRTKVCCGDWKRVTTKAATYGLGLTGILLDPPYDTKAGSGCDRVYGDLHSDDVSAEVRKWALENGDNPLMRIALCGYEGEHAMPPEWDCVEWKAQGGYASAAGNNENSKRERIWFSKYCLKRTQENLL
jgi:hypothetical protein